MVVPSPSTDESSVSVASGEAVDDAFRLVERLSGYTNHDDRRLVVAFSGGVDSSVVAAAAFEAVGRDAIAVTADSPSVPEWQIQWATKIAAQIGIEHRIVETDEFRRADYVRNDTRRCYYCKETLYATINDLVSEISNSLTGNPSEGASISGNSPAGVPIVSGTNADDLGDYRPGIQAGKIADVKTPLADLGITKHRVRALAARYGLSNHDLPASPCLASRVAYGVEVTPDRLSRIEQAESWLRDRGFSDGRVRLHQDELARIELIQAEMPRACDPQFFAQMHETFRTLGFRFVTIDIGGLQSGSMNREVVTLGVTHSRHEHARDSDTVSNKAHS